MKARNVGLVLVLAAIGAGAYLAFGPARASAPAQAPLANAALSPPSASATELAPRHLAVQPAAVAAQAARRATLFGEYASTKSYRALYDRLKNSAEGSTAEGLYVTYAILRACATVTDRPAVTGSRRGKPRDQRREEFLAALPPGDPARDKRISAFEAATADKCAGFDDVKVVQADMDKILDQSAEEGDPKARAAAVQRDLWAARRNGQWRTASLTDSQVGTLEQAVTSKDPEAMRLVGQLLSDPWPDVSVRLGPNGETVEPQAFNNAWQMLACDYGSACGDDNQRLLDECAYNGHCEATSVPDYLYYYASTPYETELMMRYQNALRTAVENGDWSQLNVIHGPRMPNGSIQFRRGPPPG